MYRCGALSTGGTIGPMSRNSGRVLGWWALILIGAGAALLIAWLARVVSVPLTTLLTVGAVVIALSWLIVLVTVPWNLHFAARRAAAEMVVSRERGISVRAAYDTAPSPKRSRKAAGMVASVSAPTRARCVIVSPPPTRAGANHANVPTAAPISPARSSTGHALSRSTAAIVPSNTRL